MPATIIYPVFDLRGDIVEHLQSWSQQDFDPLRFRIVVVASTESELDEAAIRRGLREHDTILRVPLVGRDADYWNAGRTKPRLPGLLFVEAQLAVQR